MYDVGVYAYIYTHIYRIISDVLIAFDYSFFFISLFSIFMSSGLWKQILLYFNDYILNKHE